MIRVVGVCDPDAIGVGVAGLHGVGEDQLVGAAAAGQPRLALRVRATGVEAEDDVACYLHRLAEGDGDLDVLAQPVGVRGRLRNGGHRQGGDGGLSRRRGGGLLGARRAAARDVGGHDAHGVGHGDEAGDLVGAGRGAGRLSLGDGVVPGLGPGAPLHGVARDRAAAGGGGRGPCHVQRPRAGSQRRRAWRGRPVGRRHGEAVRLLVVRVLDDVRRRLGVGHRHRIAGGDGVGAVHGQRDGGGVGGVEGCVGRIDGRSPCRRSPRTPTRRAPRRCCPGPGRRRCRWSRRPRTRPLTRPPARPAPACPSPH